jgi:hypothetical protein
MKQRIPTALLLAALVATSTMPAASAGPQTGSGPSWISAAFFGFGAGCLLATWFWHRHSPRTHNPPIQTDNTLRSGYETLCREYGALQQHVENQYRELIEKNKLLGERIKQLSDAGLGLLTSHEDVRDRHGIQISNATAACAQTQLNLNILEQRVNELTQSNYQYIEL